MRHTIACLLCACATQLETLPPPQEEVVPPEEGGAGTSGVIVRDWGLMGHDDGDLMFTPQKRLYADDCTFSPTAAPTTNPTAHARYLRCRYRGLRAAGIDTLKLNVFSNLTYFEHDPAIAPAASRLDSRLAAMNKVEYSDILPRIEQAHALFAHVPEIDPVRIALTEFRAAAPGGNTVLSFRIADSHFVQLKQGTAFAEHPYTSQLFLTSPADWRIGSVPAGADPRYANLLTFGRQAVREHFKSVVEAAVDRYGDVIDGIEIDFTRTPMLFAANVAQSNSRLIDAILVELRSMLEARNHAGVAIFVRVPPEYDDALSLGLDVAKWVTSTRPLVDVVVPSQLMTTNHAMKIEKLIADAHAHQPPVKVYAGLPGRRNTTLWRMDAAGGATVWAEAAAPTASCDAWCAREHVVEYALPAPDYVVGAAVNARAQGADGVELFNFLAESQRQAAWFTGQLVPRLHATAPAAPIAFAALTGYNGHVDDIADPRLPLPVAVVANQGRAFAIRVGSTARFGSGGQLRVGLLSKAPMTCNLQATGSAASPISTNFPRPATLDNSSPFANTQTETGTRVVNQTTVVGDPAGYFPERYITFVLPATAIYPGDNYFRLTCSGANTLIDAELRAN